jgi:hypothetical protein
LFENRVLRSIFGPVREEVIGHLRKLSSEEFQNLFTSLNIRMIKPREMRWVGKVADM